MKKPGTATRRTGTVRCAIYTRKSSEEGLEQEFNSLQAQREACEAFIDSQRHEGWVCLRASYDDGGFSGATMDRPALQRLLADITAGRVGTVVVYKIDRLTRSLADFAKIVEILDARGASFVSVTQQFNTTTSMGRLTLNVLLSFAQFEREVIGERIRDKIAASKKKGMWMGGVPPLGYGVRNHKLVMIDSEADTVRLIFRRYAELGSVRLLQAELEARGIRSKSWTSVSSRLVGGKPFSRGALYLCCRTAFTEARSFTRANSILASTRRSSISRCGTRSRLSLPATSPGGTRAHEITNPASSPACCLMATAIG
jgi:site-specific DNA recombinase